MQSPDVSRLTVEDSEDEEDREESEGHRDDVDTIMTGRWR